MRKLKAPFLAVIIMLFNVTIALATPTPPKPTAKGMGTMNVDEDCEPICQGGDQVPIDDHIMLLAICGLALGATVIYKNKIKKASV
ncbi:hypothetical protein K6T82_21220 [Flavobacterium sp. 17A]|uniref:LPXTG cell wall anchor domain-containing protein n=1 Tax=Flavobacterium potami TaxID=2872310 RepID=A0A9X1HDS0_9FLAO|nr:hypothetical protein [Flavobacterium potami]MBZ4037295.1 hypothetical protein [Flavobacterium potami]